MTCRLACQVLVYLLLISCSSAPIQAAYEPPEAIKQEAIHEFVDCKVILFRESYYSNGYTLGMCFASSDDITYQFPLYDLKEPLFTNFAAYGSFDPRYANEYHAAEDYLAPAGTPVYAFADGTISYSGPMDGYGWLIIIDHVKMNLYSLYGHLSPSRWRQESGMVEKGKLIAYLGDSNENGGSTDSPLTPHLHFGVRVGQRSDYSSLGDCRWQAGWVKSDPKSIGWLQPSKVIAEQGILSDAFAKPKDWFFKVWGPEILVTSIFVFIAPIGYVIATKRFKHTVATKGRKFILLLLSSFFYGLISWISFTKLMIFSYGFVGICLVSLVAGVYELMACMLVPKFSSGDLAS